MNDIALVGVGALGSHVLLNGRNWNHPIKVIDFDLVEQKNVQAQMHTRMSLRRNKALAAQQAMLGMFGFKVEAIPHKLVENNMKQLLGDALLIIDCTDNIAARQVIQTAAREFNIPCLHGCLSADGGFARVVWTEHFRPDAEDGEGQATCEDGEMLPFYAMAAAHIAWEAQRFLADGTKRSFQILPTSVQRLA